MKITLSMKTTAKFIQHTLLISCYLLVTACQNQVDLSYFEPNNQQCFDRNTHGNMMIVDSHHHFRPFGGEALDYQQLIEDISKSGVLFVNGYGIGQTLPQDGPCQFPSKCPTTPIKPTMNSDLDNINNQQQWPTNDIVVNIAMTFFDLNNPEPIKGQIEQLQRQYPNQFRWAGEVNLVKQALFSHGHRPTTKANIIKWQPFMDLLKAQNIPLALHADIGNDKQPTEYLALFDEVLNRYPDNRIVWLHMGISKEQLNLDNKQHIAILSQRLSQYPNLYIDISWRILQDHYFNTEQKRQDYVELLHQFPTRFITGSDFVANKNSKYRHYKRTLSANSGLFPLLNDNAYRQIVLGQNYFKLAQMPYVAPKVCVTN